MAKTTWRRDYTQDAIGAKERFDDVVKHVKEPPDGQIPLGDTGIYTSPNLQSNEPVSPFDCEQYPDSPYCGGNPWTRTPVGAELDWGIDECGVWVEATPVLGFTKLPPVSAGWRRPGKCREEEKPPQPPPPPEAESRPVSPLSLPKSIDPNVDVLLVLINNYNYFYSASWGKKDYWGRGEEPATYTIRTASTNLINTSYPPRPGKTYYSYFPNALGESIQVGVVGGAEIQTSFNSAEQGWEYDFSTSPPTYVVRTQSNSGSGLYEAWITADHAYPQIPNWKRYLDRGTNLNSLKGRYYIINFHQGDFGALNKSVLIYGKLSEIAKDWEGYVVDESFYTKPGLFGGVEVSGYGALVRKEEWSVAYCSRPDIRKYPPPPDQRKKKDCCMQCCSGGSQAANKQNQDLAELLRIVRKIDKKMGEYPFNVVLFDADDNKVGAQKKTVSVASVAQGQKLIVEREEKNAKSIGIDHFPIYAPSSMIEDESNGLLGDIGDLKNKIFKQKIESLAELQLWRAKNDYEIFGRWQEVIPVEDADPTIPGNQPKRVVLPNMAKSFKEIILLLTVLIKAQGFSLDAILKMYVDLAGVRTSTAATEAITRDIQDYLDYPTVTKSLDVPIGVTIPTEKTPIDDREDIENFLKTSTVKVVFDDWTGEGSIHDMLLVLLDAAARTIQKPHT